MRAVDSVHICPYTGLRSFTEEESLYFKGRDLQTDQIAALLEQNKFLMVTGASGEGKSSLIYGGLIPNVRAGFFKARFTNWIIADFRPERSPVRNMARSLANHFPASADTIETELRRGYSSLIDLYLNSSFYLADDDQHSATAPADMHDRRRKAANLMIIVDQFEEFFTNPENFYGEAPSQDAQIVVNLVLETARIAWKRNLPVYVVCTMRSDYIGQCSAFRGLPEYIGFSQFFVPRLKRRDLKQVIEEPAILSGNRIAQRLVERLVYDISDGIDQLPILQHALSRVWEAASEGQEEMDLIHYAMVGGMPESDLPDEDMGRFHAWLQALPEHHRKLLQETGLNKVIEIHANLLYEDAWNYHNQRHPEKPITQQEAKRIIALTFSCLTKIDNSRAVRNRMTLGEITQIINTPELNAQVVGSVLNLFREEGNSFIRPFLTQDPATHEIRPETVLDITHESLIRNWNKLNQWANTEFEFYSTFLDFQKQLQRWKASGKDSGYLLPIGPLNYFETWYRNCKPNAGWIRRYAEVNPDKTAALRESEAMLGDMRDFLKKSARKEAISRAFMKYGPQRIATGLAILIMVGLTGFYWYDAEQKRNNTVINQIRAEAAPLLKGKEVSITEKAVYLLMEERYNPGSLIPALKGFEYEQKTEIGTETYKLLLDADKHHESELRHAVFQLITEALDSGQQHQPPDLQLSALNKFLILLSMDQYYNPSKDKQGVQQRMATHAADLVRRFYADTTQYRPLMPTQLNVAVQQWLTVGGMSADQITGMIRLISPLSGANATAAFQKYYARGSFEPNGRFQNNYGGGFHTLATLYAAAGDTAGITWCFREMLETNQRDYLELARVLNNHLNVFGYLYQYGHRDKVPGMLKWINEHTNDNPPLTLLRNVVIRSGYISHLFTLNTDLFFHRSTRGYFYPNLYLADRTLFDAVSEDYEAEILKITNKDERNFQLAMQHKRKAMFYHKYWWDRGMKTDTAKLDNWLSTAVQLYREIDTAFLRGTQSVTLVYNGDGVRTTDVQRKNLFIYPDYRDGWFAWTYHSDYFWNHIRRKGIASEFYQSAADLQQIHLWLAKGFEWKTQIPPNAYSNNYPIPDTTLVDVLNFVRTHPQATSFDTHLPLLILANRAFDKGDTAAGYAYFQKLNLQKLGPTIQRYEYLESNFIYNMINRLAVNLAAVGRDAEAIAMTAQFPGRREKALAYFNMAGRIYRNGADPRTFAYLDSGYRQTSGIDYSQAADAVDPRFYQIQLLSSIGSEKINKEAARLLLDMQEGARFGGILFRVEGQAYEGNYYRARMAIPGTLTESQDLICRAIILREACRVKEKANNDRSWEALDTFLDWGTIYSDYLPT